ncbi:putative DsbA family dithiol-disulfide isomerase [Paenibacillus taihuensis]|uniref:Putative DsbA family dithiol-disulfide isomerase n=1 Tax=Paenibacillus taihuensis TaxID=1156355 RepID=A0A3D9SBZ1_9BACL|nr:DsbA family oxidoreductase [Paenibacillus taihuensis]REE91407.1 putative DsbA family dithiol-disulfide isomerase [Paenibacillus taihuensis]
MHIDVYSDVVCPWCRIGKQNLLRAIELWKERNDEPVTVTYHAYQLDPNLPEEGRAFDEVMMRKMGGRESMKRAMDQVTRAGAAVGVTFRFDQVSRMPNTRLAHRFIALLPEERRADAVEELFRAYFEDGADVAQLDAIMSIAEQLGVNTPDLEKRLMSGEGGQAVDADLRKAQQIGITGVPFFIFNNRYALSGAYPAEELLGLMGGVNTGV